MDYVYVLMDDREHEPRFYAFSSWDKMCRKAAKLIMKDKDSYPEWLRTYLGNLFSMERYDEVLYSWRENYGWEKGKNLRTEVIDLDRVLDSEI